MKIGDPVIHIKYPQFFGKIVSLDTNRATVEAKTVTFFIHPNLLKKRDEIEEEN